MSEVLGSLLGGGIGSSLSDLTNSVIQPVIAIITLFVFVITLPEITKVLGVVAQTGQQVNQITSYLNSIPAYSTGSSQPTATVSGGTNVTPGQYVYQANPQGGGQLIWQASG